MCCNVLPAAVFLSVFKWEARKGWRELVAAFQKAFTSSDPVELIILTKPFFGSGTVSLVQGEGEGCLHTHGKLRKKINQK
jgi:hypothetical protein